MDWMRLVVSFGRKQVMLDLSRADEASQKNSESLTHHESYLKAEKSSSPLPLPIRLPPAVLRSAWVVLCCVCANDLACDKPTDTSICY